MKRQFFIDSFVVSDETFTLNQKWVLKFCDNIRNMNLSWSVTTRADRVNSKIIQQMRKAGCPEIKLGAETGDNAILKRMNKHLDVEDIVKAAKLIREEKILVKLLLIYGLPGENLQSTQLTIQMLEKVKADVHRVTLFTFRPLPGSYIWLNPTEFCLRNTDLKDSQGIHEELNHYWGTKSDFKELKNDYAILENYIQDNFQPNGIESRENSLGLKRNKFNEIVSLEQI